MTDSSEQSDDRLCPRCRAPVAAGTPRCPACAFVLVPDDALARAQEATHELGERLRASPYFRNASLLPYVPRGQVRGFLEDPSHPLSRDLLRYLHRIAVEGGRGGLRHLLALAGTRWLTARDRALAAAIGYVYRRHRAQLRELSVSDEAARLRALRDGPARGQPPAQEFAAMLEESFARWHAQLARPT
jgi:hypothetical protein